VEFKGMAITYWASTRALYTFGGLIIVKAKAPEEVNYNQIKE